MDRTARLPVLHRAPGALAGSWHPVMEAWLSTLNSTATIRAYRADVEQAMASRHLRGVRELREVSGSALMLWRGETMTGPWARTTKARRISALRSFLRFSHRTGACPRLSRDVLDISLPVPDADGATAHQALTEEQLGRLLAACDTAQDRAVIAVLCSSAPRRAELAALECVDVVRQQDGWVLQVREGKGGRGRVTPLAPDVADLVLAHLAELGRIPGDAGPLFLGAHGRVKDHEVYGLVRRMAVVAGLGRGISPHDLRATAATRLYRATHDIRAVQALLGHRNLATTERYLADVTAGELRSSIPPLPT